MKKAAAISAIFAILLNVINASELTADEKWERLRGQNCSHERAEPGYQGKTIDVNSVLDAKPDGYILKLHYTSIGIKNSGVLLSSAKDEDEFSRSPRYDISIAYGNRTDKAISLYSVSPKPSYKQERLASINLPDAINLDAPTEVGIAITNDGTITVAIEGKTILTHQEPSPLPIRYIEFQSLDGGVDYYYNCTPKLL